MSLPTSVFELFMIELAVILNIKGRVTVEQLGLRRSDYSPPSKQIPILPKGALHCVCNHV